MSDVYHFVVKPSSQHLPAVGGQFTFTIHTCGASSTFDSILHLYSDEEMTDLVASNDDGPPGSCPSNGDISSLITILVPATVNGTEYFLKVSNAAETCPPTTPANGQYQLTLGLACGDVTLCDEHTRCITHINNATSSTTQCECSPGWKGETCTEIATRMLFEVDDASIQWSNVGSTISATKDELIFKSASDTHNIISKLESLQQRVKALEDD
jgi:hypothetical protein